MYRNFNKFLLIIMIVFFVIFEQSGWGIENENRKTQPIVTAHNQQYNSEQKIILEKIRLQIFSITPVDYKQGSKVFEDFRSKCRGFIGRDIGLYEAFLVEEKNPNWLRSQHWLRGQLILPDQDDEGKEIDEAKAKEVADDLNRVMKTGVLVIKRNNVSEKNLPLISIKKHTWEY